MRLIDADTLRGRVCEIFLCAEPGSAEERRLALVLGLIDSEHTITPPPNDPLPLEELREMGGEPYWHVGLQEGSAPPHWNILEPFYAQHIEDYWYGERWLAYRRRPEEGTA